MDFCGLKFRTPLVLLSGCVGFGEEYTRVRGFSNRDVGAVCLKGTTLAARLGNPPHRLCETPQGLLNAIGLQNPGVEQVVVGTPSRSYVWMRPISSPTCPAPPSRNITRSPAASTIPRWRQWRSTSPVPTSRKAAWRSATIPPCRPGWWKPADAPPGAPDDQAIPNETDIAGNARGCIEAGTDAFAAINTLMGMAIDVERREPVLGNNQGGLSGPAIKPVAVLKVHQVYQVCRPHRIPIIGQGGVTNAQDALEFLLAGASAVGVRHRPVLTTSLVRPRSTPVTAYPTAGMASPRSAN